MAAPMGRTLLSRGVPRETGYRNHTLLNILRVQHGRANLHQRKQCRNLSQQLPSNTHLFRSLSTQKAKFSSSAYGQKCKITSSAKNANIGHSSYTSSILHKITDSESIFLQRHGLLNPCKTSYPHALRTLAQVRSFRSKQHESEVTGEIDDVVDVESRHYQHEQVEAGAWLLRLANENGYLSWCRNTYIASILGATVYTQEFVAPYAKEATVIFLLVGGFNMIVGTGIYIHNVVHLRHKILMSKPTAWFTSIAAALHLMLWAGGIAIYLGYVEDEEEEAAETARKRSSVVKNV